MANLETQVLIIGGGATGTGIARDLALRGIKCILAEKDDINAGASGANHGLLHSGSRYVASDAEAAIECREEGEILKRLAPHCIDNTGGIFAAVSGDDEKYISDFPSMCQKCGISAKPIDIKEAKELEPVLSEKTIAAYLTEDASIDPFMLSLENMAQAVSLGSSYMRHAKAIEFKIENGKIKYTKLINSKTGEETKVFAEQIVNAAGAWAGEMAELASVTIPMVYSKGSLVITQKRLTKRVINRLRKASDADILVPGGAVSIFGTTSIRINTLDAIYPTVEEVDFMISEGAKMVPILETTRYIRAYAGVRPLISLGAKKGDDRSVSRGFVLLDHTENGVDNFITITGGKLTTYRLMAEKTADLVCRHLGISATCKTREEPLPSTTHGKWTEPAMTPKMWMQKQKTDDILLCECEMISKSAVDSLIESAKQSGDPALKVLGLRSRIGKGPCQGAFCSLRIAAYMYDKGELNLDSGISDIKFFLNERWRGERPLQWGTPIIQSEIAEAIHCGFLSIEL
ncbi:MAG: anaerobic glycerol-3-phosphate dehydrogenase subunit A [Desulfobacterales bacterium]|nr:anaerobic glycerol-3-phosphate dehydrogenase subunit A [Desulfobacterales bacterium]MBF0397697.1 anaerobic glycerol-3-phosphate dehydrogenase subunit A [Desulfobacterales bacterium]